jgi:mono/diheme cytochrome c family protein
MAELRMKHGVRAAALVAVLLGAGCTPLDNVMAAIFGRSMRSQPSFGSYEAPLAPPAGSVAFSSGNYPAGPGEVNLGQTESAEAYAPVAQLDLSLALANPQDYPHITALENPVEPTEASLARGKVVFDRACFPCHGSTGAGDGPVTRTTPALSRSLLTPTATAFTDGYIYSIIRVGRGAMPQYGHQITHFDRWNVVNYVRQLQGL